MSLPAIPELTVTESQGRLEDRIERLQEHILALTDEISKLSGRVELTMRTNARIVAKIDPSFLDDPHDPEVRRRSDLLGETVLNKMRAEAFTGHVGDLETTERLHRYFRDVP
jgi:hypothetical protein